MEEHSIMSSVVRVISGILRISVPDNSQCDRSSVMLERNAPFCSLFDISIENRFWESFGCAVLCCSSLFVVFFFLVSCCVCRRVCEEFSCVRAKQLNRGRRTKVHIVLDLMNSRIRRMNASNECNWVLIKRAH